MKTVLLSVLLLMQTSNVFSQATPTDWITQLESLPDQFNKKLQKDKLPTEFVIFYVPGTNDPFPQIYDKLKGKKVVAGNAAWLVGGFKEIMIGSAPAAKLSHLQGAFESRYGTDHFPILIDIESSWMEKHKLNGFSIITVSAKKNKVNIEKLGSDRKKFIAELNKYIK